MDRVLGSIIGGALGDAWGGAYEGIIGPVRFQIPLRPALSDDTQLTLATCAAIVEAGKADPESIAAHLVTWFRAGRLRGLGSSTLKALRDLAIGTHWAVAGARGEYSAGSGAAMRIAPLAFLLDPAEPTQRIVLGDVCRITHRNDEAYVGALAVVLAVRSVLGGDWPRRGTFLSLAAEGLPHSAVRDRMHLLIEESDSPADIGRFAGSAVMWLTLSLSRFIVLRGLLRSRFRMFFRKPSVPEATPTRSLRSQARLPEQW